MARILVIAGGTWQVPIVKKAKEMGHFVVCSNLYEDSPAFRYSDSHEVANVLDKDRNLEIARKYNVDAVVTDQTDIAVPTVAYIAEKMGLLGIGLDKADLFTDKHLMREFCFQNGFSCPDYKLCHNKKDALVFLQKRGRMIIKPIDSQSSRGIHIINTEQELDECFDDCISYSNRDKAILAEQYIAGTEFTIDGLRTKKGYIITAISRKRHFGYNPNVAKELLFSKTDSEFDYNELRKINTKMIECSELPFGLTHSEYKYMDGKFYLIEMAARGGGTLISSDITKIMSGIDVNKALLNLSLGIDVELNADAEGYSHSILGFFEFPTGKVKEIQGIEEAAQLPGVHSLGLELKAGDEIMKAKDDRSRCGYYIVKANSYDELRKNEQALKQTVKIIYEE